MEFRCSTASADTAEPIAGTAPSDTEWLFVEQPGPWSRTAADDLGIPVGAGTRLQLIRRHAARPAGGVRLYAASLGHRDGSVSVRTAVVDGVGDIAALRPSDWSAHDEPLFLVCTNGRRDRCCAELGRPVAAALAERWPEATWETTHLGGHRFSGTLLALPSAITLGRLDPGSALASCEGLLEGRLPLGVARGRAGWPGAAQYADLHLRAAHGWSGLDDVRLVAVAEPSVLLDTPDGRLRVEVSTRAGEPRRQSCADLKTKPAPVFSIGSAVRGE